MLSVIRRHLNPATGIAFVALIFAVTGVSFAATGGGSSPAKTTASAGRNTTIATAVESKAKPKAKAGPRGLAGPAGKNGAPGATGPAGSGGPTGPAGGTGPQGSVGATGATGEKGTAGTNGTNGINGVNGETGFTKTLPPDETEQGAWALTNPPASIARTAISFVIPLAAAPTAHYLKVGEGETAECPGTAEAPQAAKGNLCVYAQGEENSPQNIGVTESTFGAIVGGSLDEPGGIVFGSWAVTAG